MSRVLVWAQLSAQKKIRYGCSLLSKLKQGLTALNADLPDSNSLAYRQGDQELKRLKNQNRKAATSLAF
jgi:hypothetical protein